MRLQRLQVANFRNLSAASLESLAQTNLIVGPNGSGKTSVLEAIALLCTGRSFRHHQVRPLLREGSERCVVFGEFYRDGQQHRLGVQKGLKGDTLAKLNGDRLNSMADLVRLAPVQVLHSESFELLDGPPAGRRSYTDWLLFHVEHEFLSLWREAQRALRQRNALLRRDKIDRLQLELWSRSYASLGQRVDTCRRELLDRLIPEIEAMAVELLPQQGPELGFRYLRGWHQDRPLDELLVDDWRSDVEQGHTRQGPHRADLRILIGQRPAAERLSRGQAKLVVAAMKLAQVKVLAEAGKPCLLLVDDLPAELDRQSRGRLGEMIQRLQQQVFATAVDEIDLRESLGAASMAVFHVEHGVVEASPALPN